MYAYSVLTLNLTLDMGTSTAAPVVSKMTLT